MSFPAGARKRTREHMRIAGTRPSLSAKTSFAYKRGYLNGPSATPPFSFSLSLPLSPLLA
ncbi:MAG: hypothetical protein LBJ64_06725 [Deltaproteobacteria bacterium]|nr:hypothetical protein [Deltaproteobacteria bacterium]